MPTAVSYGARFCFAKNVNKNGSGDKMASIWTDALKERVKELWATHTASQIAAELAKQSVWVTRNAVIGIINREKFTLPDGEVKRRQVRSANNGTRPVARLFRAKPKLAYVAPVIYCDVVPLGLSLIELEAHHCRFPYGDETITFCGHGKREGSSYCDFHHSLCCVVPVNRGVYVARRAA